MNDWYLVKMTSQNGSGFRTPFQPKIGAMQNVPTARGDRPLTDVVINSVTITVAD
jgi:hypothetical protein